MPPRIDASSVRIPCRAPYGRPATPCSSGDCGYWCANFLLSGNSMCRAASTIFVSATGPRPDGSMILQQKDGDLADPTEGSPLFISPGWPFQCEWKKIETVVANFQLKPAFLEEAAALLRVDFRRLYESLVPVQSRPSAATSASHKARISSPIPAGSDTVRAISCRTKATKRRRNR